MIFKKVLVSKQSRKYATESNLNRSYFPSEKLNNPIIHPKSNISFFMIQRYNSLIVFKISFCVKSNRVGSFSFDSNFSLLPEKF